MRQVLSEQSYVSPVLLVAVMVVMTGDIVTTGVGLHLGLKEGNPVIAAIITWFGLPGMVVTKAVALSTLLVMPAFVAEPKWAFRIGCAAYLTVGTVVVTSNLIHIWIILR